MTLLEFDLDPAPAPATAAGPERGSGRLRPLLLLALVLAAVAGAVLRTVPFGDTDPPAPPVSAVLTAQGLALTPDPVLALRLVVSSPAADLQLDRLTLTGGGTDVVLALGTLLPAGRPQGFDLEVPLRCAPGAVRDLAGTLRARPADATVWQQVAVQATGPLRGSGGGCGVAAQALPVGWDRPLPVDDVAVDGDLLTFTVGGLGALDRVLGVSVDGTLLSPAAGTRPTGRIAVLRPQPDCSRPDTRPVLPTGAQVLLDGPSGQVTRYAALGPVLAQWWRAGRARACDGGSQG